MSGTVAIKRLVFQLIQWQATDFVEVVPEPKARYPMNAPTATANITKPLYVINSNLHTRVSLSNFHRRHAYLHDEEAIKDLRSI